MEAGRAESQSVSALHSESEETAPLKGPASTSLIRQKWKKVNQPDSKLQGCKATMATYSHYRKHNLPHCSWWKKTVGGNCFMQCDRLPDDYACLMHILISECHILCYA